jgi:hypothetical protein
LASGTVQEGRDRAGEVKEDSELDDPEVFRPALVFVQAGGGSQEGLVRFHEAEFTCPLVHPLERFLLQAGRRRPALAQV